MVTTWDGSSFQWKSMTILILCILVLCFLPFLIADRPSPKTFSTSLMSKSGRETGDWVDHYQGQTISVFNMIHMIKTYKVWSVKVQTQWEGSAYCAILWWSWLFPKNFMELRAQDVHRSPPHGCVGTQSDAGRAGKKTLGALEAEHLHQLKPCFIFFLVITFWNHSQKSWWYMLILFPVKKKSRVVVETNVDDNFGGIHPINRDPGWCTARPAWFLK